MRLSPIERGFRQLNEREQRLWTVEWVVQDVVSLLGVSNGRARAIGRGDAYPPCQGLVAKLDGVLTLPIVRQGL
jgi:hypothetical protein